MAVYQDNAAGVTSTIGTDDYLVTGGIEQYGPIIGVLTDGEVYPYYIAFIDVADGADYETGQGTWDSGSNTLARTTIETSSNNGNAVNWGVGDKALWIVQDASLATDMDQMRNGTTKFYLTAAQAANIAASKTKTDLITVTVPANLDTMQADIAAFSAGMTYRGNWDASTGVFPGGGAGRNGDYWFCNVSGVVDTVSFDAGDSIVALVNNPSISTFAGNWSRHDSFDSVQSVAGLIGTITADDLADALPLYQPFGYKPSGENLLTMGFGDSNMDGAAGGADASLLSPNASVKFYSGYGRYPYSTGDLAWRNLHPNGPGQISATAGTGTLTLGATITNYINWSAQFANGDQVLFTTTYADGSPGLEVTVGIYSANTLTRVTVINSTNGGALVNWTSANKNVIIFTPRAVSPQPTIGLLQGGYGSTAWTMADKIQRTNPERDMYCYMSCIPGVTNEYWQPGGGAGKEGMTSMLATVPTALSTISGGAPPFFDVVYMSGGGNDCGTGVKAATFLSTWQTMYNQMVSSAWVDADRTQWFQGEIPQEYTLYAAGWTGLEVLQNATAPNVQIVSSVNLTTADGVHYVPASMYRMGEIAAELSTIAQQQDSIQRNFFRAESTIEDGATAIAHRLDTSESYVTAGAKLLQISTAGVEKYSFSADNIFRPNQTNLTPFKIRMSGDANYDFSYSTDNSGGNLYGTISFGGPNGTWFASNATAGSLTPHFRFLSPSVLTGTTSVIEFGHFGLINCANLSRVGLFTTAGGFSTTAASALGNTAVTGTFTASGATTLSTTLGVTGATTLSSTLAVTGAATLSSTLAVTGAATLSSTLALGGRESINLGTFTSATAPASVISATFTDTRSYSGNGGHGFALTGTIKVDTGASGTSAALYVNETLRNVIGCAALVDRRGFYSNINYIADTTASVLSLNSDIISAPVSSCVSGGTMLWGMVHYTAAGTNGASVNCLTRTGFLTSDMTNSGTITGQAGFTSTITSATNNTHLLLGTITIPAGNFGLYQSDTVVNRFNSGIISPWRGQSGSTAAVSVKGDRNLVFANGSTSTITLPTLTSMTTGHTAAQMSGYELVIINDRTTSVVSGTDFLLGSGTSWGFSGTCTILAKDSRTFIWNGVDTWL